MTTTTGVFAPLVDHTPLYDGLVIEGGFDPATMVLVPTGTSVWPTLTKRERHRLRQRTARLWDNMDADGNTPAGLTGDTIEVPEVKA